MHEIENAAKTSVGRAFGFALLAIVCIMFSLSFRPPLSALAGSGGCILLAAVLGASAWYSQFKPYKNTELWLILPRDARPPSEVAQRVIAKILKETYLWFARQAAVFSLVLLGLGAGFKVFGVHDLPGAEHADNMDRPFHAVLLDDSELTEGFRIERYP